MSCDYLRATTLAHTVIGQQLRGHVRQTMSKALIAFLILVSATTHDPRRVLDMAGPHVQALGAKLTATFDIGRIFPRLFRN